MRSLIRLFLISFVTLAAYVGPAHAQASRTWVSGVGDDVNPCSRTAPCKTFAGAISKTAARGEISVLDPGGFGGVTITKSISINAVGLEGGVLVSATNAIVINAAATDVVNLRGVVIEGLGTGLTGIKILSAANVHINDVFVRGFRSTAGAGLELNAASGTRVVVSDSTFWGNTRGIVVKSGIVVLDNVTVDANAGSGIEADGANAIARLGDSTVTSNNTGLSVLNGARIQSFGNNIVSGNVDNGAPTSTLPRV